MRRPRFCYIGLVDHSAPFPFLLRHVEILRASYQRWTGRPLVAPGMGPEEAVAFLSRAPFALVSHDTQSDPVFNYANGRALELFAMSWEEFTRLPSRLSAEPMNRAERARLLEEVSRKGFVDDYSGVRIAKSGRRFMISDATVWNLIDLGGESYGQAALIRQWRDLSLGPPADQADSGASGC